MHRDLRLFVAFAAGLTLVPTAGLAEPKVSTQTAPNVSFSFYETCHRVRVEVPPGANAILFEQILADMDSALSPKGCRKVEADADLSLVVTIGAQQRTDFETWGRFGLQTSIHKHSQSQLSLGAIDSKTKQALWHGQASQAVDPDKPNQSKIDAAVARMMAGFLATAEP